MILASILAKNNERIRFRTNCQKRRSNSLTSRDWSRKLIVQDVGLNYRSFAIVARQDADVEGFFGGNNNAVDWTGSVCKSFADECPRYRAWPLRAGKENDRRDKCKCRKLAGHGGDFRRHCGHFNSFPLYFFFCLWLQALQDGKKVFVVFTTTGKSHYPLRWNVSSFSFERKWKKFSPRNRFLSF